MAKKKESAQTTVRRIRRKTRKKYGAEDLSQHKALIARALILWNKQPVSQIKRYIDSESVPLFAEVLRDLDGPILFYEKEDRIVLQRWVRVLLEEGKDSKLYS